MYIVGHGQRSDDRFTTVNFAEFENVKNAFAVLIRIFADELHHDNFEAIRMICLIPASRNLRNKVRRTTDIYSFFELLTRNPLYLNWMNVEYLDIMASASKSDKLKGVLKNYTDVILSKTLKEIWECMPSFHSTKTKCYSKVKAKFQEKNPDYVTVQELTKKCKPRFIEKIALHIMQIDKGSLTITWCMLAEETYQAYLSALNIPKEHREDDFLQIGFWVVYHPQFVIQELRKVHGEYIIHDDLSLLCACVFY